jgi:hypothetical protein
MAIVSLVFALFTVGYVLGVWTACLVFKQSQKEYEAGAPWHVGNASRLRHAEPELVFVAASREAEAA